MKNIKISPFIPTTLETEFISANHVKIMAHPFEEGFAITIAHPIRRLLMSSSIGFAPIAIKIDNVAHEFDSIRGVVQDVAPVISNIRNLDFKVNDLFKENEKIEIRYDFNGPIELTGKDLNNDFIEIINTEHVVATVNEDASFGFSLIIQRGIGYVSSEELRELVPEGYIPLDAYFTPVRHAVYKIENVLVEGNPSFEKIVFEVGTNGQIEPMQAFKEAISVMHSQMNVFGAELNNIPLKNNDAISDDNPELKILLSSVEILNLEHRPSNCLQKTGIKYIGELVLMSESDLKGIKNLGKKSYDEIANKLQNIGYPVGAELSNELALSLNKKLAKLK